MGEDTTSLVSEARRALSAAAGRSAALISSVTDLATPVSGSEWSVGQAAAHLAIGLRGFTDAAKGEVGKWEAYAAGTHRLSERVAALNVATLAAEPLRTPDALGALVTNAADGFLSATAELVPGSSLPTPWYGDHASLTVAQATCLLLGELLIHGYDIAQAVRRPWPITDSDACLVFEAIRTMLPRMVNSDVAGKALVSYDVRIGRTSRFVVVVAGGVARVEYAHSSWHDAGDAVGVRRVDCHIAGRPAALLLVGYGRRSQWSAIGRGQLVAWGRRPWLGFRFVSLFPSP